MKTARETTTRSGRAASQRGARLCLVNTPCPALDDDRLEAPLGLLYVASAAQSAGHEVCLVDGASRSFDAIMGAIPDGFDAYGFGTCSVSHGLTVELASALRRRQGAVLLVAGGPHASALPRSVLQDGFDVAVVGEGEIAMVGILDALAAGLPVPSIVRGTSPDCLDDLPFPDYGMVDLGSYSRVLAGERTVSVLSSRGCPFQCVFCNSIVMGAGRRLRTRTAENLVTEIRSLKELGFRSFRFQDDNFAIAEARVEALTPALEREEIRYRCFARVSTFTPRMAHLLVRGGCVHVSFGVESGSAAILEAMVKHQTPAQIRDALHTARAAGLRTRVYLIVGFPGETDATVQETLDLLAACPFDEFSVYPLLAYPGTPLHERPEDFGITHIDTNYASYLQVGSQRQAGFTLRTHGFDEEDVRVWRDRVLAALTAQGRLWAGDAEGFK